MTVYKFSRSPAGEWRRRPELTLLTEGFSDSIQHTEHGLAETPLTGRAVKPPEAPNTHLLGLQSSSRLNVSGDSYWNGITQENSDYTVVVFRPEG